MILDLAIILTDSKTAGQKKRKQIVFHKSFKILFIKGLYQQKKKHTQPGEWKTIFANHISKEFNIQNKESLPLSK